MRTQLLLSVAAAALAGCVVLPAEPYSGYSAYPSYPAYVAPAPAVVVTPSIFFGGDFHHHRHWR